ncbi:GDSL-type esterase/lipase family protein [Sphingomonas sp. LB-2]|uniref:GDSL-type esterase/lipase family protein n=1 Tax=Sphingomonas caeni TaxID=2984949 RepID=UPI00222FDE57|nr:GDSL-type esterase/lipase family protein [Sphingomonas caeni]MCW3848777.1 GDSL-type esterase/lipase family protein [Sphingomonas caeni]
MDRLRRALAPIVLLLALAGGSAVVAAEGKGERWVAAWGTSQQIPEERNALKPEELKDATLRQIVRIQIGGKQLRIRLSNAYGTQPLTIGAATIARSADNAQSRVDPDSLQTLTFGGKPFATIPAGAEYWSDPVSLPVAAGTDLAVSIYLPDAPAQQTGHPGSRATSYYLHGDLTAAPELLGAKTVDHWYQLAGIETVSEKGSALVIIGDSITDGSGVKPNTNLRWTDALQLRLRGSDLKEMAILNAGLGGNRLLLDGLGPNALARFDRDILSPPGVTHMIVLEGVNDLGTLTRDAPATPEQHAALVRNMIGALRQMVARARSRGIVAIGATILPYGGSGYYHPGPESEADRQAVNAWIRAPGNFDGVIDLDAVMRDPARPTHMLASYDSGDGLHPSMAGYQAMADAVPLALLGSKQKPARAAAAKPEPAPMIAFTFDDMPAHAALPQGETRVDIADRIIKALKAVGAPATGFINGVATEREPASVPVLANWRAAGFPLGNHGWAHLNLDQISDDQFVDELKRNEPLLQSLMGKQDWHWFRYPFLAEGGADPARRARIRTLLAANGYKVAPVTMGFDDWAYNDIYARCVAKGDTGAIAQMETWFLDGAEANIARYRAMAKTLYGHDVPYVILMHLGAFDARMMPRLLALYRKHGFRFVSLEEAMRDPVYKAEVNPALPPEPQGLEGALNARKLPFPPGYTRPALDSLCR